MPADRPNIVFVVTDQQRFDTIDALGASYMDTPNLDRLANEGTAFTNCHVTAPSCAPARASLFTGLYPHTTGIYRNGDEWRHSWVEDLSESGYDCINVGKMHTQPYETPMGFDERYVVENKDRYLSDRYYFDEWDKALKAQGITKQQRELYRQYDDYEDRLGAFEWELPERTHSDVFVGDTAEWWLDDKPNTDQPLFLQVGFPGPHPPYDPIPRYAEEYADREFPLPDIDDADLAGQPSVFDALRQHHVNVDHDSVVHQRDPTDEQLHRQRAYYTANVAMIDEQVGKLLDALDRNGYLDDCIVVFTSDHGDALCEHGHSQKWTMYEEVTRVPALVWASDGERFGTGRRVDGLCSLMDLGPTILELAGVERPEWMQAESLLPAIAGREWEGRDHVFAEQRRDGILDETAFMTMVRGERWKLVHFVDSDEGQLFDLASDPGETDNRWDDPEVADRKRELLDVLRDWRIRSQSTASGRFADAR
ncbi:sulfatase family protein [Candidatus Halobonum tyrrellensis]|uniref:Sulfatase n=1 Tax=Candidatus Halobonum tyrrellensis G22 TaxID=1324957 RepID=V4HIY4_9EURY|nr:sulfatase-like hydrolase/transferase [Candidatus Halobonum tyrrellensis]ESP89748.1 sulfatase [Candidatus Halobonum tyrrellensis G22]